MTDLSQESLSQKLKRDFRFFPIVDSSNDIAQEWLREGANSAGLDRGATQRHPALPHSEWRGRRADWADTGIHLY